MIVFIVIKHCYVVFSITFTNSKSYRFHKHHFHAYFYCCILNFLCLLGTKPLLTSFCFISDLKLLCSSSGPSGITWWGTDEHETSNCCSRGGQWVPKLRVAIWATQNWLFLISLTFYSSCSCSTKISFIQSSWGGRCICLRCRTRYLRQFPLRYCRSWCFHECKGWWLQWRCCL